MKFVVRMKVNLCRASFWGQVAMMMKTQNLFFNTVQVKRWGRVASTYSGKIYCVRRIVTTIYDFSVTQEIGNVGTGTLR